MKYRPDIDGLRAIAVLSVLLFHTNETFLSGGFVGVDIFFVISGYLITKLIVSELDNTQNFSFKTFYLRRARRLFPALFFTFLGSFIFAYGLFSPQDLAAFGESVVYAIASISNVLFWNQSDYFDQSNLFKPMLHTWSLGIEEQFYFIWPALLWFLYSFTRPKLLLFTVAVLGLSSLYLNHYFLSNELAFSESYPNLDVRSTVFYLLPFRVFEFAIGAVLVWINTPSSTGYRNEGLFSLGLGLIAYSLVFFTGQTTFPSFNALLPCVGAALIIASGGKHRLVGLLDNQLMVGVGLISYSLYLIHWPIIVFYNYWKFETLGGVDYLVIVMASLLAAILMYRFIEQPFRKPKQAPKQGTHLGRATKGSNRQFVLGAVLLAAVLSMISWNAYKSSGWLWRYPAEVVDQLQYKHGDYSEYFWNNMSEYNRPFDDRGKPKVLIIGDSMAADLLNAIVEGGHAEQLDLSSLMAEHNCRGLLPLPISEYSHLYLGQKDICLKEHQRLADDPRLHQADAIVLASYWWESKYVDAVDKTIAKLNRDYQAKVFLAGIKTQRSNGILFFTKNLMTPHADKLRTPPHPETLSRNNSLQTLDRDFVYISLLDEFCDEDGCQRVLDTGHVVTFDESHLSPAGAKFVGAKLNQTAWFKELLSAKKSLR